MKNKERLAPGKCTMYIKGVDVLFFICYISNIERCTLYIKTKERRQWIITVN